VGGFRLVVKEVAAASTAFGVLAIGDVLVAAGGRPLGGGGRWTAADMAPMREALNAEQFGQVSFGANHRLF
jgi:hypothetical protein